MNNEPVYISNEPITIDPFAIYYLMMAENEANADDAHESWDSVVYQRLTQLENESS